MRLNNQKSKNRIISVYFVFVLLFIFGSLSFSFVKGLITDAKLKYSVMLIILILVFAIVHRAAKYFEYDSDGHVLVLVNKGLLLTEFFNYRENRAEFPKSKLLYYKFNNYIIYKSLNLYILSNGKKQKRLKFNITLLSSKKLKYLKQSLDKVVKQNKANG